MIEALKFILSLFEKASPELVITPVSPDGGSSVAIVKDGFKLVEVPNGKSAAPTRVHTFLDTASFIAWLNRFTSAPVAEVFADPAQGSFTALCGPLRTSDRVSCKVAIDPTTKPLIAALGKPLTQEALRALLMALRAHLTESNAIAQVSTFDAKITGTVTSHIDPRTGAKRLKVVSQGTEYNLELPPELHFTLPLYAGGEAVAITLSLCPDVEAGRAPSFTLTWPEQGQTVSDAFYAEVAKVRAGLGEGWLVMLGTPGRE